MDFSGLCDPVLDELRSLWHKFRTAYFALIQNVSFSKSFICFFLVCWTKEWWESGSIYYQGSYWGLHSQHAACHDGESEGMYCWWQYGKIFPTFNLMRHWNSIHVRWLRWRARLELNRIRYTCVKCLLPYNQGCKCMWPSIHDGRWTVKGVSALDVDHFFWVFCFCFFLGGGKCMGYESCLALQFLCSSLCACRC